MTRKNKEFGFQGKFTANSFFFSLERGKKKGRFSSELELEQLSSYDWLPRSGIGIYVDAFRWRPKRSINT